MSPADLVRLQALLAAPNPDPEALLASLAAAREAGAGDGELARDLDRHELTFLRRHGAAGGAVSAALLYECEALRLSAEDDVAALFDLCELRAGLQAAGLAAAAAILAPVLDQRIARVGLDATLVAEARERQAALATEEEDLPVAHRILLLQHTRELLLALHARGGADELLRLARRLARAETDRRLAQRLEQTLSRRGTVWLENLSFFLLLAIVALLAVDAYVPRGSPLARTLELLDAAICAFFVAEFALKLALAPARLSWFWRHVATDLLPALPALLLFTQLPAPRADEFVLLRFLRLLNVAAAAGYVQALLPALRLWRALIFLVRGGDAVVRRFSPILNRNLVFFETAPAEGEQAPVDLERQHCFAALRREHVLLGGLPAQRRREVLASRAQRLTARLMQARPVPQPSRAQSAVHRDIPVEEAIEHLYAQTPERLALTLGQRELLVLDRVVRTIDAPVVRHLPFFRRLAPGGGRTAEERVTRFLHCTARELERWRARLLWFADLHGIVTGPQVLDRVANALTKATQRPAVRLLLFGGLFSLVRLLVGSESGVGEFLKRFVATPLVVLGGACLALLVLGRWLKALAGEASGLLQRTSEAQFLSLLELGKLRHERLDLAFLAQRALGGPAAAADLAVCVRAARDGHLRPSERAQARDDAARVALLYLHYLDGGILHASDVKTTEQLLANLSLHNIRRLLGFSRRDRKRLHRLSLDEGTVFGGPYLWFQFIVESVALETGKRILDYNKNCLSLAQRRNADAARVAGFERWLARRRSAVHGRMLDKVEHTKEEGGFTTTEFTALDFLSDDPEREAQLRAAFGDEVVDVVRRDRARMLREIFGTRPLDRLPASRRSLNFFVLWGQRLSGGRVLMLPLFFGLWVMAGLVFVVRRIAVIAREVLRPERALERAESGRAAFAVAMRKIRRMKGPGLLEAMRLRVLFDPGYVGAPESLTAAQAPLAGSLLERDLAFLLLRERDKHELRTLARQTRARVRASQELFLRLPAVAYGASATPNPAAELGLLIAGLVDRDGMRSLLQAEAWLAELPSGARVPRGRRLWWWLTGQPAPLRRLRTGWARTMAPATWAQVQHAWWCEAAGARRIVAALADLHADETPPGKGLALARRFFAESEEIHRDLLALRAVQSLTVLDVRNYRDLVFRLGEYAADGEDPQRAAALPAGTPA